MDEYTGKYKIIRFFQSDRMICTRITIRRGLTREEAAAHCNDPETSSSTCTKSVGKARTRRHGPWFDGFDYDN